MLFTENSLWTMVHGIALGGAALMALAAALFAIYVMREAPGTELGLEEPSRKLGLLTAFTAVTLWLTVIVGTYIVFPPYRVTPPEGTTDLTAFPRALILGNPETAWLHAYAMETKEHVPFMAAMIATAVAFVALRYRASLLRDDRLRGISSALITICIVLVAYVALLGVFINKVAPVF
jgi:hypothetical protein